MKTGATRSHAPPTSQRGHRAAGRTSRRPRAPPGGAGGLRAPARAAQPRRQPGSPDRGTPGTRAPARQHEAPAPDSLRELAFLDRINEIGPADQLDGAANLPRLYDEDYTILALLDRAGLAPRTLIGRAVLPGRAPPAQSSTG